MQNQCQVGVGLLQSGNYAASIASFRDALEQLYAYNAIDGGAAAHSDVLLVDSHSVGLQPEAPSPVCRNELLAETGYAVFDQAFTFIFIVPTTGNADNNNNSQAARLSDIGRCLIGTVILFDLALCYHIRSSTVNEEGTHFQDIVKAKRLYEKAMSMFQRLLQEPTLWPTTSRRRDVALLLLGMTNNLACLAGQEHDHQALARHTKWYELVQDIVASTAEQAMDVAPVTLNFYFWRNFYAMPAATA